jgi:SAM-dependent methyltransferase
VSFDLVAPHYRWLEAIAFGNALQRARTCWIDTISRPKRTLIVGEGDGRFLCELVRAFPTIDIDCIDASEAILQLARARLRRTHPESFSRVYFFREDILKWTPRKSYDLLVTHFFLDCFSGSELLAIIAKLASAAEPGAVWLLADFTVPRKRFARAHARLWLRMMYTFFRATARSAANELVDPSPYLAEHGFIQAAEKLSRGSMLRSDVYVLRRNLVQQNDGNRGIHLLNRRDRATRWFTEINAGIAQLVEQLICNQQVVGSNPTAGSSLRSKRSEGRRLEPRRSKTKARLVELLVRQVYANGEKPMSSHVAPQKKGKSKAVQRVAESRDQSG